MSELELEAMNLRLSRREELRLDLILAALRAGWPPLKLGRARKTVTEGQRRQPE